MLTLDANRASSVGSMALDATASAVFLHEKNQQDQPELSIAKKKLTIWPFLHLFLQREASTKKRLWTGASLRQTATEPLEATEKFRASSKNFGSRRRAFSGTMRHWPRWPEGPQMTAFLPRQDSPPGLWLQRSRAWLACWGLCRRLVQRSVRSQPMPTS